MAGAARQEAVMRGGGFYACRSGFIRAGEVPRLRRIAHSKKSDRLRGLSLGMTRLT